MTKEINLPAVTEFMLPSVKNITDALHVPREVLASDEEITYAWRDLPRVLNKIHPELRDELIARMCVAIAAGLFDGAINYVWNASVRNLRQKVSYFGFSAVSQILGKTFDEQDLIDLKDAELLNLCLKLNLISEEGFFFLDQCRDIRNNFSAAHLNVGLIDDKELISFINRCSKYALSITINPRGVDISAFISAIKGRRFTQSQLQTWVDRINCTHDAQRELLFGMLHGIYCDPGSNEEARINGLSICENFAEEFTPATKSNLLDRHYDYQAKGDTSRHSASQIFFEKLELLSLLNQVERHAIISDACKRLISVHLAFDNFYNEPPFAFRLQELTQNYEIPDTAKEEFVITVLTCYVGNQYGVSNAAVEHYESMIRNFSPKEINILLRAHQTNTTLANRVESYTKCKNRYLGSIKIIDEKSVPDSIKNVYKKLMKGHL